MVKKRGLSASSWVLASLLYGCFPGPIVVRSDASAQDDGTNPQDGSASGPITLVIRNLQFSSGPDAFGLNLDHLTTTGPTDTAGCGKADVTGATVNQFPGESGVDNAWDALCTQVSPNAILAPMRSEIVSLVAAQRVRIVVVLRNVDDTTTDDTVNVDAYVVLPTFGVPCDDSRALPIYAQFDRGSTRPTHVSGVATIAQGVLSFSLPRTEVMWLPLTLSTGAKIDLPLRGFSVKARLQGRLSAAPAYWGARLNASELFAAWTTDNPTLDQSMLEQQIGSATDLRVVPGTSACSFTRGQMVDNSDDVSFGFGADLGAAVLSSTPTMMQVRQTCALP